MLQHANSTAAPVHTHCRVSGFHYTRRHNDFPDVLVSECLKSYDKLTEGNWTDPMQNSDRVKSLCANKPSGSSPQIVTTGGAGPDLPVLVLLGQKKRKQQGSRGDSCSSCCSGLASHCGLWGPEAWSTVNNSETDQGTGVIWDNSFMWEHD